MTNTARRFSATEPPRGRTMSHTPEPWKYTDGSIEAMLPSGQTVQVTCMSPTHFTGSDLTKEAATFMQQETANAARIVSAVNGCAGLNPAAYRELYNAAKMMIEKQRSFAVVTAQDVSRLAYALHAAENPHATTNAT